MSTTLRIRKAAQCIGLAAAISAALVLGGCVNAPTAAASTYGNYVTAGSAGFNQKLAADTIKQLVALYPPASTQFNVAQPTPDPFGVALIAGLREKGYAVMESNPVGATQPPAQAEKAASGPETALAGLDLRYLIDQQGTGNLYRLSLVVGGRSLSRAYVAQNEGAYAAGSWVRKE
jgi:type IV secretion system protein TrbH